MKGTAWTREKQIFCRTYLQTPDVERAEQASGVEDGYVLLRQKDVRRYLTKARQGVQDAIQKEDVVRCLCRLAFSRPNDAIALACGQIHGGIEAMDLDRRRSSSWTVCGRCRRWASCWAAKAGMTRPRPFSRHWKMQRVWRKSGGAKQWIELFEKTKTSVDLVVRCVAGTYLRCADLRRGGAQRQDRVHGTELFVLGDSVL